jgi:tetratricopeptide (TPR) repeat protein
MKRVFAGALVALILTACAQPATPSGQTNGATGPAAPGAPAGGANAATPVAAAQQRIDASRAALIAGDATTAVSEAEAAVQADPNSAGTHYALGNALNQSASAQPGLAQRDAFLQRASAAYQKAIEINGNSADARHNLGTVYIQLGQIPEARAQFEAALQLEPNDAKTHYMMGTIFLQEDPARNPAALQSAQTEFETALRLDPNRAEAYIGLAQVFTLRGDAQKALENARRGVELSGPNVDPFSWWQLAQAQCAAGDKPGGQDSLQKVLAAGISDPQFNQQVQQLLSSCK